MKAVSLPAVFCFAFAAFWVAGVSAQVDGATEEAQGSGASQEPATSHGWLLNPPTKAERKENLEFFCKERLALAEEAVSAVLGQFDYELVLTIEERVSSSVGVGCTLNSERNSNISLKGAED